MPDQRYLIYSEQTTAESDNLEAIQNEPTPKAFEALEELAVMLKPQ